MIIGCYSEDGTPAESISLEGKRHYFELEVCLVQHPRRYPEYNVVHGGLAFCDSRESAEKMMSKFIHSDEEWQKDIYCFYIYERVLDVPYERSEYTSCYLYDEHGSMIDKRTFPSYWSEEGFSGRNEDEIRFKFGDLAEFYDGETVSLVYVLASPREKEWYIQKAEEEGKPYNGDISDDSYTIIERVGRGQFVDYMTNHNHVDALSLFRPHYPIPKKVQKYYDTFWALYEEDRRECYGENPGPCQI